VKLLVLFCAVWQGRQSIISDIAKEYPKSWLPNIRDELEEAKLAGKDLFFVFHQIKLNLIEVINTIEALTKLNPHSADEQRTIDDCASRLVKNLHYAKTRLDRTQARITQDQELQRDAFDFLVMEHKHICAFVDKVIKHGYDKKEEKLLEKLDADYKFAQFHYNHGDSKRGPLLGFSIINPETGRRADGDLAWQNRFDELYKFAETQISKDVKDDLVTTVYEQLMFEIAPEMPDGIIGSLKYNAYSNLEKEDRDLQRSPAKLLFTSSRKFESGSMQVADKETSKKIHERLKDFYVQRIQPYLEARLNTPAESIGMHVVLDWKDIWEKNTNTGVKFTFDSPELKKIAEKNFQGEKTNLDRVIKRYLYKEVLPELVEKKIGMPSIDLKVGYHPENPHINPSMYVDLNVNFSGDPNWPRWQRDKEYVSNLKQQIYTKFSEFHKQFIVPKIQTMAPQYQDKSVGLEYSLKF